MLPRLLLLIPLATLSWLFLIDLCNVIYACGCRSLWAGAAAHCNIVEVGPPDCPWCAAGVWGMVVPMAAIVAAQGAALLWPGRLGLLPRLLLTVLAFPVAGGLVGLGYGVATGYWW